MQVITTGTSEEAVNGSMRSFGRRSFLVKGTLSGTAIALLAGCGGLRAEEKSDEASASQDVNILTSALSAEHEAVAAYQVGAQSGLLQPDVLKLAVQFQGHHKEHVSALAAAIEQLGGSAVGPEAQYVFPVESLKARQTCSSSQPISRAVQ